MRASRTWSPISTIGTRCAVDPVFAIDAGHTLRSNGTLRTYGAIDAV